MKEVVAPQVLVVRLLEACDAGCFMCSFARSSDAYRFGGADAKVLSEAVDDTSIQLVRFTGGEPLLHNEISTLVRTFSSRGKLTSIITNGGHLAERAEDLAAAGLSQVIVSLDGPDAETHDRFRQWPGLFERATRGLVAMRALGIRTRVNTVAGPHNVARLGSLFDVLHELGVEDWSIIPLKAIDGAWRYPNPAAALEAYRAFQEHIARREAPPRLIGYSSRWMGRDHAEEDQYLDHGRAMTPARRCLLVDRVRYIVPSSNEVFPCNCVPHRTEGVDLGAPLDLADAAWLDPFPAAEWLRENGARVCRGCEPANTALGDGAVDLVADPFGF